VPSGEGGGIGGLWEFISCRGFSKGFWAPPHTNSDTNGTIQRIFQKVIVT